MISYREGWASGRLGRGGGDAEDNERGEGENHTSLILDFIYLFILIHSLFLSF